MKIYILIISAIILIGSVVYTENLNIARPSRIIEICEVNHISFSKFK